MDIKKAFNSIGHVFAVFFQKMKAAEPKVEAGLQKAEATEATVETVTAAIPVYGPLALSIEKCAYAIMGEVSAVLSAGDAAAAAKLQDAGLDIKVIQTVQAAVSNSASQIAALAKK